MNLPEIVSREQWLAARKALLAREKELTRTMDALNADRRRLPMVQVDDYVLEGPNGKARLLDLFDGRRQLIVQHVMFGPEWEKPCPSCSAGLDEMSAALLDHLRVRDTVFAIVSRAPYAKIAEAGAGKSWPFEWYSSYDSSFNYDFHVTLDSSVAPVMFNYRDASELAKAGMGWVLDNPGSEQPGVSCFLRDGDDVFHTYSTFGRGTEQCGGAYAWLDMTALGRQEEWEEPKGRSEKPRKAVPDFAD